MLIKNKHHTIVGINLLPRNQTIPILLIVSNINHIEQYSTQKEEAYKIENDNIDSNAPDMKFAVVNFHSVKNDINS